MEMMMKTTTMLKKKDEKKRCQNRIMCVLPRRKVSEWTAIKRPKQRHESEKKNRNVSHKKKPNSEKMGNEN